MDCQSQMAWYVLDNSSYRKMFGLESQAAVSDAVLSGKASVNQLALTAFVSTLQLKAYSPNTIRIEAQLRNTSTYGGDRSQAYSRTLWAQRHQNDASLHRRQQTNAGKYQKSIWRVNPEKWVNFVVHFVLSKPTTQKVRQKLRIFKSCPKCSLRSHFGQRKTDLRREALASLALRTTTDLRPLLSQRRKSVFC